MGISAFRKSYPQLNIAKGLVIAPCPAIIQLSEEDYAVPWDLSQDPSGTSFITRGTSFSYSIDMPEIF
jgi:hypothetical protein